MLKQNAVKLAGEVSLQIVRPQGIGEVSLREIMRLGWPRFGLTAEVNDWRRKNLSHLLRGMLDVHSALRSRTPNLLGFLHLTKIDREGRVIQLGLASARVVTTAWANYLVDALQNQTTSPIDIFNFHGLGTGTNAEAAGDTALQTELTTQYSTNNIRATGTKAEGATANIYRSIGINTVDATVAITELGVFSNVNVAQGTLMDRSVFSAVNLVSSESLQTTYELTITAGG